MGSSNQCNCKEEPVEIVVILDRSGSMGTIRNDAIGGFNTFLEEQKKLEGAACLTLVLFDHEYSTVFDRVNLKDANPLTTETFVPRGNTALNDAIGRTITNLNKRNPKRAVIAILTDGEENASREYNLIKVRELIKGCEARGWTVAYLAANQDAFAVGSQYGVLSANTIPFQATASGTYLANTQMSNLTKSYRSR